MTRSAVLPLALPTTAEVRVTAYDVLGRRVAVLADEQMEAGRHRVRFDGASLPSGVYLVQAVLEPEGGSAQRFSQKLVLTR